jgi:hypothetical protein
MSTFDAIRHSKLCPGSPHSSFDSNDGFDTTPESKLTAFSPEDRCVTGNSFGAKAGGAPLTAGYHDPFVTTNAKNKEVKLSATASTFQPFGINAGSSASASSATRVRSSSTTPGTLEYLQKETLNAGDVDRFGTFTTDTGASRCMKVTSLYGANAQKLVEASLAVSWISIPSHAIADNLLEIRKIGGFHS